MKLRVTTLLSLVLGVLTLSASAQQSSSSPRVFLYDARELKGLRAEIATGKDLSDAAKCAAGRAKRDGDKALMVEIKPVTSKAMTPPSGDKHDYMSLAPYFWPDPTKKDGLPYIRRDGERNPELATYPDDEYLSQLIDAVDRLGRGYYLTGDEKYAARAAFLVRMWFVDPATRMNPNMNFAQAQKGKSLGRNFGIIETLGLLKVVDAVGLLAESKAWTKADQQGMERWFAGYIKWLQTSENGKLEAAAKNNHGTHYDEQLAGFALFVGQLDLAKQTLENAKQKRLASQIEPDGAQPLELARTQSWVYSTFNLSGYINLARLGDSAGVDLWNFQTKDGRGIRRAIDYLAQFTAGGKKWEHQNLSPIDPEKLNRLIRIAGTKYKDKPFADLVAKSANGDVCPAIF